MTTAHKMHGLLLVGIVVSVATAHAKLASTPKLIGKWLRQDAVEGCCPNFRLSGSAGPGPAEFCIIGTLRVHPEIP